MCMRVFSISRKITFSKHVVIYIFCNMKVKILKSKNRVIGERFVLISEFLMQLLSPVCCGKYEVVIMIYEKEIWLM